MVKKRKNLVWSIAFILPALSLLFVFLLYPVFEAVKLSFYKWTGIASAKPIFIGLENYKYFSRQISGCRCETPCSL